MNIYDISEKAGVSIATVSRVLNGNEHVSPATRNKILSVIEENEYIPNVFARGLTMRSMRTIGVLCPDSSDPYLAEAVFYLEQNFRKEGYDVLLCCTGYHLSDKQKYMELLLSKLVDGIVLIGSTFVELDDSDNAYIQEASKKIPIAILNAYLEGEQIYSTLCDDRLAVEQVVLNLIDHGRRTILYLYNALSYSGYQKLTGYKQAHKKAGLPVCSEYICYCRPELNTISGIKQYLRSVLAERTYDAVVASDDKLAVCASKVIKETSLCIPDDIEVIGYNNSALAECCDPELSSINMHLDAMCNHLTTSLIAVLSGEKINNRTIFPAELIRRGTTIIE